nr:immunoglobulin light chain junction region [Macaca mulatta]MOW08203.1 immunoglobulin light chain junction region [Macaca mulatta]MOW08678.1 immunoglobulin light chain junction region [Macaca mulatta]MOW10226.1 immunoglobulin light chain junction region [Macaca mulatta]MOW10532.1 immunoglobulin light chain junction region [Macaca mulatta]
CQQGNSIPWTF